MREEEFLKAMFSKVLFYPYSVIVHQYFKCFSKYRLSISLTRIKYAKIMTYVKSLQSLSLHRHKQYRFRYKLIKKFLSVPCTLDAIS